MSEDSFRILELVPAVRGRRLSTIIAADVLSGAELHKNAGRASGPLPGLSS
jgi:hypothetical protein